MADQLDLSAELPYRPRKAARQAVDWAKMALRIWRATHLLFVRVVWAYPYHHPFDSRCMAVPYHAPHVWYGVDCAAVGLAQIEVDGC